MEIYEYEVIIFLGYRLPMPIQPISQINLATKRFEQFTLISLVFLGVFCSISLFVDFLQAGNNWKQGDWLINNHNTIIRRGILGSIIIFFSDLIKSSPLIITLLIQQLLIITLFSCTYIAFKALLKKNILYTILIFSSSFFVLFWASDFQGSMRKELIAYTALSMLVIIPLYPSKKFFIAFISVFLFLISTIGHEINALLTPAFIATFIVAYNPNFNSNLFRCISGIFLLLVSASLLYAVYYAKIENVSLVCEPLIQRGLLPDFCDGAIAALDKDFNSSLTRFKELKLNFAYLFRFFTSYLIAVLPIIYLISQHKNKRTYYILFALFVIPITPLYPLAIDWGRWMSMHIVSFSLFFIAIIITEKNYIVKSTKVNAIYIIVLISILFTPNHVTGYALGNFLRQIFKVLQKTYEQLS